MMTDPIADMLTRLRNANTAFHDEVLMPSSKLKESLARILEREGYIAGWDVAKDEKRPGNRLKIELKYTPDRKRTISGLRRISKPGLRVYSGSTASAAWRSRSARPPRRMKRRAHFCAASGCRSALRPERY